MPDPGDRALIGAVTRALEEAKGTHDAFCAKVEKGYKSWRGILESGTKAETWTSKLHPPYILQLVETIVANQVDDRFRFQVKPSARLAPPDELARLNQGAKSMEILLRHQLKADRFDEKQRPFVLQNAIAGLSVGKMSWCLSEGMQKKLRVQERPVLDPSGEPRMHGIPGLRRVLTAPQLSEVEEYCVYRDDPTFEVRDVRDFFFPESAVSLDAAPWVVDRVWMTFEDLKEREKAGVYKNVDQLKESRDQTDDKANRESELFNINRAKNLIAVDEMWDRRTKRVTTIGNGKVLLRDVPWPFWHMQYPFVTCSTTPDLFLIPGVSIVERVEHIQQALWTLMNQRIDNLELINNAIVAYRNDLVEDPETLVFAPREMWGFDGPVNEAVQMFRPDPTSAGISLPAEANLRGDMQNITGGGPFLSGSDSSTIDQTTATGVSIVTSLAQRVVQAQKQHIVNAYRRVGEQFIQLNQQFIREERLVQIVGPDGAKEIVRMTPEELQGQFQFDNEPTSESLMRQERRAEAGAVIQLAANVAPIMQATGAPLNMKAFAEYWLDAYDIQDKERFFSAEQQNLAGLPGQQQQGAPQEPGPGGVTGQGSIDPAVSPSHQASISPETAMQRAGAMGGGVNNA